MVLRRWGSITRFILVLSTELIKPSKFATVKSFKTDHDVSSVGPSSERMNKRLTLEK